MNTIFSAPFTLEMLDSAFPLEKFGRPNKAYHHFPFGIRFKTRTYKAYNKAFLLYLSNPRTSRFTYDNKAKIALWLEIGDDENDCKIHAYNRKHKLTTYSIPLTRSAYLEECCDITKWNELMNEPISEN